MDILKLIKKNYPKLAFIISLIIGAILVPAQVYISYPLLVIVFLPLFAASATCVIKMIKEKVKAAHGHGILSAIASILGLAALNACTVGFACTAAGVGIISVLMPAIMFNFFTEYAPVIAIIMIIIQLYAISSMKCIDNLFKG
ncbi:MAG: hypothetical protein ABIH83_02675 [Candidatus Micrarchaeota archaeon]